MPKKRRKKAEGPPDGNPLERLAISEAYRDAWDAAALARAEDLMRDPELRRRIDRSILDVLEGMVERLKKARR